MWSMCGCQCGPHCERACPAIGEAPEQRPVGQVEGHDSSV